MKVKHVATGIEIKSPPIVCLALGLSHQRSREGPGSFSFEVLYIKRTGVQEKEFKVLQ